MAKAQDQRRQDNGQGQVKDPAHDGRLKQNGGGEKNKGTANDNRGKVLNPATDGRLVQNGGGDYRPGDPRNDDK